MKFKIYTTHTCGWCVKAKNWMTEHGHEYEEVDVANKANMSRFFDECGNDVRTVPQILIDGKRIGGYEKLIAWAAEQENGKEG